jgi:Holliday junction resolvase
MTAEASQRGRRSRRKGAEGERELASWLTERGFPATRTLQRCGRGGVSDVIAEGLDWAHLEVKRTETFAAAAALRQATQDAAPGKVPVVFWRQSRGEWVAVLPAAKLLELVAQGGAVDAGLALP